MNYVLSYISATAPFIINKKIKLTFERLSMRSFLSIIQQLPGKNLFQKTFSGNLLPKSSSSHHLRRNSPDDLFLLRRCSPDDFFHDLKEHF